MKSIYVGAKTNGGYELFSSQSTPTEKSHGSIYRYVIGPFDTQLAAELMRDYGHNNPHMACVEDCEKIARTGKLLPLNRESGPTGDNLID